MEGWEVNVAVRVLVLSVDVACFEADSVCVQGRILRRIFLRPHIKMVTQYHSVLHDGCTAFLMETYSRALVI